jgi:alpha-beta hydrolase superfamily lysophospholipase
MSVRFGQTRDGVKQLKRHWKPATPKAAIVLVHGIGEHSGRYLHVGEFLALRGYDVIAFDNRGFGESGGRRAHVDDFEQFLDDIEDQLAEQRALGVPVILFGHSLGGLMSASYLEASRPQPDLAVLSSPALGADVPRWQRIAAPILGRLVPSVFIKGEQMNGLLSRDEEVEKAYHEDPLVILGATAGLGRAIFERMAEASADMNKISVPTYVFHGEDDELVPQTSTLPLADVPSITYRSWPTLRHECMNEPEKFEVLAEVGDWLDSQIENLAAA